MLSNKISKKIRKKIIELSFFGNSAHLGSSLSCVEILISIITSFKKNSINDIIFSKGHASMAYYASLEYFGIIKSFNARRYLATGTDKWGHVTKSNNNFQKFSFGSLGYGLGISCGLSIGYQSKKKKHKIFCVISDGELNEGSIWESLLFISHHNLKNIIIFVDNNKIQSFGRTADVLNLSSYKKKFESFGFLFSEVNGHSITQIKSKINIKKNRPHIIICNTVKGKGVEGIENTISSHYKPATKKDLELYK